MLERAISGGCRIALQGVGAQWGHCLPRQLALLQGLCASLQSYCFAPIGGLRGLLCWEGLHPQGNHVQIGKELLFHCKTSAKNSLG